MIKGAAEDRRMSSSPTATREIGPAQALLAVALLVYPAIANDFFLTQIGALSLIEGMLGLSLTMLAGYGGMVSLAQLSVAGVAGYVIAIFGQSTTGVHSFDWPWMAIVPLAIACAACASALTGWISARTAGIYTIMITLAIATAVFYFAQQNYVIFNGHSGFAGVYAPVAFGVDWRAPRPFYYLTLVVAAAAYASVLYGRRSIFGLTVQGIRDNERRMRALGYNTVLHKVVAWLLSGVIAGAAGVLLVWFHGRISPSTIDVAASLNILVIAVIGGLRHPIGPFLGALVVVLLQTFASDLVGAERFNTLIGLVFLVIVYISDDGILGLWRKVAPWLARADRTASSVK